MTPRGEHPDQKPMWQPVSQVGVLLAHVTEQLGGTREMHRMLAAARPPRPGAIPEHVLDNDTVARTLAVYGQMATDYRELFAEQARRWTHQPGLPADTREQVDVFATRGRRAPQRPRRAAGAGPRTARAHHRGRPGPRRRRTRHGNTYSTSSAAPHPER